MSTPIQPEQMVAQFLFTRLPRINCQRINHSSSVADWRPKEKRSRSRSRYPFRPVHYVASARQRAVSLACIESC